MEEEKFTEFEHECRRLEKRVEMFAKAMKAKLREKAVDKEGWSESWRRPTMATSMLEHAAKLYCGDAGQAVDVANYAMFLFYLGSK